MRRTVFLMPLPQSVDDGLFERDVGITRPNGLQINLIGMIDLGQD